MKRNVAYTRKQLRKIRELATKVRSPFRGLTLEQAIEKMRKVRQELWEEKFAARH